MQSFLIRECLSTIENHPEPDLIDPQIDQQTGLLKWCQLLYSYSTHKAIRLYVYCNRNQVRLGDMQRLWVPLEKIQIVSFWGSEPPTPIGTGGWHCLSFNRDRTGVVDGIKEAFQAALADAEANEASCMA